MANKSRETANLVSSKTGIAVTISGDPVVLGVGNTEHVRVTGGGLVGIGTDNPTGLFQVGSASTTAFYIDPIYGSVGIGTLSGALGPNRKLMLLGANASPSIDFGEVLDIKGGNFNQVRINHNTSTDGLLLGLSDNTYNISYHHSTTGINESAAVVNVSNDALHLGTNNSSDVLIDHEGRLGIGTTSVLTSTWGDTAPGSSTTGTQIITIYGHSPAINIIHDIASHGYDDKFSAINFGRRGGTSNPYRAVVAYDQKLDWMKVSASNSIILMPNRLVDGTDYTTSTFFSSNGNVGIATTVPEAKLHVSQGNIKVDSGFGIDFGTTDNSAGTTTSEIFSDYEEGTWTPVIRGSGTAGTYQTNAAVGWYRKVGDLVHYGCRLDLASSVTGGGTGQSWITGLPFGVKTGGSYFNNAAGSNGPAYMYGISITGTYGNWFAATGYSHLLFVSYDNAGAQYVDAVTMFGANDIVGAHGRYIAA